MAVLDNSQQICWTNDSQLPHMLFSGLSALCGVNPNKNNDNQIITKLLLLIIMTLNLEFCRTAFRLGLGTQSLYGALDVKVAGLSVTFVSKFE